MNAIEIPAKSVITIPVEIAVGGLLFDMDGLLVRSTHGDERCWIRWAAHHGLSEIFDLRRTHGRRAADTIREHLPNLSAQRKEGFDPIARDRSGNSTHQR